MTTQGSRSEEFDDEADKTFFMVMGDSNLEEQLKLEVRLFSLKDKLYLCSQQRLISLMNQLIDDCHKLTTKRNLSLNSFARLKYEYIDIKKGKSVIETEKYTLKEWVTNIVLPS